MGLGSIWHWLVLILVVVLLFGRGRISDVMGDIAKGIKSFKKGLSDDEAAPQQQAPAQPQRIQGAEQVGTPGTASSTAKEEAKG